MEVGIRVLLLFDWLSAVSKITEAGGKEKHTHESALAFSSARKRWTWGQIGNPSHVPLLYPNLLILRNPLLAHLRNFR